MLTFQKLITVLTEFWASNGCVVQQGHDVEVGAGTFNPSTFLRCLGPEPYNTVYVEPSRRPQDARFGENPNRTQLFHQLQVVMKPSPLNIQELYLQSLEAIGFNLKEHDIRFVHDDWESPTLGAWGLGWEVWCDGSEVSQFTYFQAVAGTQLKPISVEITYGLERLCMLLQGVDNFFDMKWNDTITFGNIFHRSEVEWSEYNFMQASTQMWLRHFEDFETEAKNLASLHLPIPAYDFVLKASHAFNILEARGVLSTTERTGYITRIRSLARMAAEEYLAMRKREKHPLLHSDEKPQEAPPEVVRPKTFKPHDRDDFLLEIGSEELPATFVPIGIDGLKRSIVALLKEHKLEHGQIEVYGTPRRLAVIVHDLVHGLEEETVERRGPSAAVAFDDDGNPTKQCLGFLKATGLEKDQLETRDGYLFASVTKPAISTFEILGTHLPSLILHLHFPKTMRWNRLDITYARPLKWIVALFGKKTIPFHLGTITAGRISYGHAQLDRKEITISKPSDYLSDLKKHKVLVNHLERKLSILDQLAAIEQKDGVHALHTEKVLAEVLHLTEWPMLTTATFSEAFLKVPDEVLTSEMVEHQRYFPLTRNGALTNTFVITADNTPNETIKAGNVRVLSARLADGTFLYEQDLKTGMAAFHEKLSSIVLHKELGTIADKVKRLEELAPKLAHELNLGSPDHAKQAATLCKDDLASELVGEFPDLQGTIGKYYALHEKQPEEVAIAIEEHYLPKGEKGPLPASPTGIALALADKIDTLTSYFSIGLKPTSSSDPYALRRCAIGLLKILIENGLSIDLENYIKDLDFITGRAKSVFEEYGFAKDEIEASLRGHVRDPYDQYCRVKEMHAFRESQLFPKLYEVYKRAKGQLAKAASGTLDPSLLQEEAEKALYAHYDQTKSDFKQALEQKEYAHCYAHLASFQEPLSTFFDEVKVLADDPAVQKNRLGLLSTIFALFETLLDFSKIQQ